MAFSGGTFSRTFDCTTDRDNGVKILASKFDTELDGMATGLSTCILKDGTQTCTAAIPFAQGITLPDDKTIAFGTNSDVLIQYDETTTDSLKISAAEGAGLAITLMADEGDDAGDEWKLNIADGGTLTLGNDINSAGTYVTHLTITPNATVANSTMAVAGNLTVGGALTLGSGAVISEAELETIDGITPGTVLASKAMVVDSDKDITGGRNLTITGELDAATLDISGNADIDGTLEADAMTLNGTAITATATLDTGISNNNVPKFTSGAADNDFLRIDGTAIEGRSAAEVLSDIAAAPAAGSGNIVTTGALNSGSITSGFGAIDNGSSAITTTGVITGGTLEATADTSAGDNAAIGYTSAEGLILTGQGSTSDITLKNDADATVFTVPTGTDDILFPDSAKAMFGAGSDLQISHDGSTSMIDDQGTGVLEIRTNGSDIRLTGNSGSDFMVQAISNGAVNLSHDGSTKLATASTGVDITGAFTATDGCTITTADNTTQLTLESTDADANRGPQLDLHRNSGSPADDDALGYLRFLGDNSAGEVTEYARFEAYSKDVTDGTEDGQLDIATMTAGTLTTVVSVVGNTVSFQADTAPFNNTDAKGTTIAGGDLQLAGLNSESLYVNRCGSDGRAVNFRKNGTFVGGINVTGSGTTYESNSDYRLKTAVSYSWDATTRLKQLKPARFKWIVDGDDAVFVDGFLAHEVQTIIPESVSGAMDAVDADGAIDPQGIDHSKIVPILTKALIESVEKIEALEARITALEAG